MSFNIDFAKDYIRTGLKKLFELAKNIGIIEEIVPEILEFLDDFIDTQKERTAIARGIVAKFNMPILGKRQEQKLYESILLEVHERIDQDEREPEGL